MYKYRVGRDFLFRKINIELVHDFNSIESLRSNRGKVELSRQVGISYLVWFSEGITQCFSYCIMTLHTLHCSSSWMVFTWNSCCICNLIKEGKNVSINGRPAWPLPACQHRNRVLTIVTCSVSAIVCRSKRCLQSGNDDGLHDGRTSGQYDAPAAWWSNLPQSVPLSSWILWSSLIKVSAYSCSN